MLTIAFSSFGTVQNVKLVRDKGGADWFALGYRCSWFTFQPGVERRLSACVQPELSALDAVAYIKFDKASSAARAIEVMHEAVLNEGRGPLLKVFLAEAPSSRCDDALP